MSIVWSLCLSSHVALAEPPPITRNPEGDLLTLQAVEAGDFDCSGTLDQAVMYADPRGGSVVEVAFDVPQAPRPVRSPREDLALRVDDVDGDQCEDLLVTTDGVHEMFTSTDTAWIAEGALDTRGDDLGDLTLVAEQRGDGTDIGVGMCWVPHKCWNYCERYTWIPVTFAGIEFGSVEVCTQWRTICQPMPW